MSIPIVVEGELPPRLSAKTGSTPGVESALNRPEPGGNPTELTTFSGKSYPKPPRHLRAAGKALYRDIVAQYRIHDAAGLALITTAAEALDRIREAQAAIRKHGALVPDRYGALKQNPACFLERDARAGMLSALRALNLDLEPLRDRGRSTVFNRK
jgi:P27 family predicted phage terminase small subunit